MLQETKLRVTELFNGPNARVILILGTLLIAVLAGGAGTDHGG